METWFVKFHDKFTVTEELHTRRNEPPELTRQRLTDLENTLMVAGGKGERWLGGLG